MRDSDWRWQMITNQESELQAKITAIQTACREAHEQLEVLLEPLREPIGEYVRELKILQTIRFEQETGLKIGDELYPTSRFAELQIIQGNGHWWEGDNRPIVIGETLHDYLYHNEIQIRQGSLCTKGIPVLMVMEMRHEWMQRNNKILSK